MNKRKLSIVVITMNRCDQVVEALESCFYCTLPYDTEFIIVDNASIDNTRKNILEIINKYENYIIDYYKLEKNKGVAGGRLYGFEKATGEYVYFLDDDAVIDKKNRNNFFIDSINFLDENKKIASLSTHVEDKVFGDRTPKIAKDLYKGKARIFTFIGTSHFLRKDAFSKSLYLNIEYGAEEFYPSILAIDNGFINLYDNSIGIIHKPKINKWIDNSDSKRDIVIKSVAIPYATKHILYPEVFYPIMFFAYQIRLFKNLRQYKNSKKEVELIYNKLILSQHPKIKAKTVLFMFKEFGFTVF